MDTDNQGKILRKECISMLRQLLALGVGSEDDILFLEQKDQIAEMTGSDFLSNIKKEWEPFILQAAKDTGFNIYVEQEALDNLGRIVEKYVGVYTRDINRSHEPFWNRFEELWRKNGNV
jgi:hypothetical protein